MGTNYSVEQITGPQAAAIASIINLWSERGEPGITFGTLNYTGLHVVVRVGGLFRIRYTINVIGGIECSYSMYLAPSKTLEQELADQGLRLAKHFESGWYTPTSCGKVWATDLPLENEA